MRTVLQEERQRSEELGRTSQQVRQEMEQLRIKFGTSAEEKYLISLETAAMMPRDIVACRDMLQQWHVAGRKGWHDNHRLMLEFTRCGATDMSMQAARSLSSFDRSFHVSRR